MRLVFALLAAAGLAPSCSAPRPREPALAASAVDSALPPAEALRRFRREIPEVAALQGGATTRDGLVERFVHALEARDTVVLAALVLTRAEFAWLYYPTSRMARPPYELPPDLAWFQLDLRGQRGIAAALEAFGGRRLAYRGYDCPQKPVVEGRNRLWAPCLVRLAGPGGREERLRLFGAILERGGVWKFVNYSNRLD
ncbi:MAG TPA: hypothetical protein VNJ71_02245 [Gemmatimonadales bacterium]|nr:hypothetical protein [Gemmatimonadales bacterium]